MTGPRMAMSADFLAAFAKLPSQQQRLVRAMIARFERDSKASGLNYEKIAGARDPNMRSLRIDGGYRAIVLKPAAGNVHILLWADKHDDAYRWATRHACSINAETGALQVYQPQQAAEVAAARHPPARRPPARRPPAHRRPPTADTPPAGTPGIFGRLRRRQLLRLGVPAAMAAEVLDIREEAALEAMAPRLPVEAYEGLFLYMAGETYEQIVLEREAPPEPVDTTDFATALTRDEARSRFVVIDGDRELEEMFSAPLERWRVFLHPSQRRLVERDWNGPVRVLGGAGTGKTVVAMHRARWLARHLPEGERILFTTFTRNLAADIENNLRAICTPEEMRRIEVVNLDRWVQRFLRGKRYRFRLTFDRDRDAWREALAKKPAELELSDRFYDDEWEQVIQANGVTTREEYLRVARTGRGVRLNRAARAEIWPVFEEYRAQLAERGVMEVADCYRLARALLERDRAGADSVPSSPDGTFTSVVVDEAQDMVAQAWRLIRSIVPNDRNDLFIVGDAHQRIYSRHRVVLGRYGIEIRGRARKLRLNYRTTEETRRWASRLLDRCSIDDLDGGADSNRGVHSIAHGPEPRLEFFDTRGEQAAWLVGYLKEALRQGESLRGTCVVARTRTERNVIADALTGADLPVEILEADSPDASSSGVRLATMHRVKGLEFDCVVIASVNEHIVPLAAAVPDDGGPGHTAAETVERALLYVAATRAKKELVLLSFGAPSSFVKIDAARGVQGVACVSSSGCTWVPVPEVPSRSAGTVSRRSDTLRGHESPSRASRRDAAQCRPRHPAPRHAAQRARGRAGRAGRAASRLCRHQESSDQRPRPRTRHREGHFGSHRRTDRNRAAAARAPLRHPPRRCL